MRLSAIGIFEIVLNTFTQNNDFIRIFHSILFTLSDEL